MMLLSLKKKVKFNQLDYEDMEKIEKHLSEYVPPEDEIEEKITTEIFRDNMLWNHVLNEVKAIRNT